MRKLAIAIGVAAILTACAKKSDSPKGEQLGTREFEIEDTKPAFNVLLGGVHQGTPDYNAVWAVIERANSNGQVDSLVQIGTMIEGGIAHCLKVSDPAVRGSLIDELKRTSTSLEESHYSIVSVDDCT